MFSQNYGINILLLYLKARGLDKHNYIHRINQWDHSIKYNKTQIMGDHGGTVVKVPCYPNRKVAGSIPDGVIGIFDGHNPGIDSAS